MRSGLFIFSTLLSSVSSTVTSSTNNEHDSIELRSAPGTQTPILGIAPKSCHVKLRRGNHAPPRHLALRSVLGLDQDHLGRRQEGEPATAVQLKGESYIADVTIGDQEIPLLIDTGSADLWVAPDNFVCLDENHNETSKEACNIPVYFEGTFGAGAVEDQYFSISCAYCRLSSLLLETGPPLLLPHHWHLLQNIADISQTETDSTSTANTDTTRWN